MSNAHVQRQYRSQRVLCVSEVGLYDGAGRSVHMWRAHVVSILNSSDINFRCCCWTGSFAALYQYNAGSLCKRTTVFQLACTQHVLRKSSRWPRMCHPVYFRAAVSTPDCCFQCRRPQTQRVQSDQETESRPRFSDGARGVSSAIKQSKRGGADSVNWDSVAAPTKTYFSELWKQRLDSFDQTELSWTRILITISLLSNTYFGGQIGFMFVTSWSGRKVYLSRAAQCILVVVGFTLFEREGMLQFLFPVFSLTPISKLFPSVCGYGWQLTCSLTYIWRTC